MMPLFSKMHATETPACRQMRRTTWSLVRLFQFVETSLSGLSFQLQILLIASIVTEIVSDTRSE
jgi:hypothetical protein